MEAPDFCYGLPAMCRPPLPWTAALAALTLMGGSPGASGALPLRYVVAPLLPRLETPPQEVLQGTRLLEEALDGLPGVRTVPLPEGFSPPAAYDAAFLMALAASAGAQRAVGGTLEMQAKVHYPGTAWWLTLEQVDLGRGGPWGRFERVHVVSGEPRRRFLAEAARALRQADPTERVPPVGPPPAPPPDAPRISGMALVPAGDFVLGSDFGEADEGPRHKVYLDSFYVDLRETSNAEHAQCVAARVCRPSRFARDPDLGRPEHPVAGLTFDDAVAYCRWRGKRLPTEAEWERAARGTDERRWPWGDRFDPRKVNMHNAEDGWATSAPVDAFPEGASPVGALQMAGNVWEWTSDWYAPDTYRRNPPRNPRGPATGERRVIRGGSWRYDIPFYVSAHNRSTSRVGTRFRHVGVRCFRDGPRP